MQPMHLSIYSLSYHAKSIFEIAFLVGFLSDIDSEYKEDCPKSNRTVPCQEHDYKSQKSLRCILRFDQIQNTYLELFRLHQVRFQQLLVYPPYSED